MMSFCSDLCNKSRETNIEVKRKRQGSNVKAIVFETSSVSTGYITPYDLPVGGQLKS